MRRFVGAVPELFRVATHLVGMLGVEGGCRVSDLLTACTPYGQCLSILSSSLYTHTNVPHATCAACGPCSTLTHMAPESLAGQTQLNASIDLYAFGEASGRFLGGLEFGAGTGAGAGACDCGCGCDSTHGSGVVCPWCLLKHTHAVHTTGCQSSSFLPVHAPVSGILMWQMVCGTRLYQGLTTKQIIRGVVREHLRPTFPVWVPPEYRCVRGCGCVRMRMMG